MSEVIPTEELSPEARYLGFPAIEYSDLVDDKLQVSVWLRGAREPQTNYRMDVVSWTGKVVATDTTQAVDRVLPDGTFKRSALKFSIDPAKLPNGNFKLILYCLDQDIDKQLRPTPGLLASSRPRILNPESETPVLEAGDNSESTSSGKVRRYQFFPGVWIRIGKRGPRAYPRSVLRIGDTGTMSRFAWGLRNFWLDLAFLFYGAKFSFSRAYRVLTKRKVGEGPIWLIGERSDTARDNGVRFFEYLRREHPDLRAYYVIDEDSPMLDKVEPLGNVVYHSSKEHRLLMHHADVLANAYSIKHMAPRQWGTTPYGSHFTWRIGSRRVYLKHGVHDKTTMFKRGTNGYDLVVTVGQKEGAAFETDSGYTYDQIKEVGLPRYDTLVREPGHKTVLMMLTWRRYFVPKLFGKSDEVEMLFAGSRYEKFLQDFLGSERLAQVLEKNDLRLAMVPHYNMASEANDIPILSDRVDLLDGASADIPALLRQCDVLITDYSSVHFDVGYLGTPVIYSRFDREEYLAGHASPSWFSYEEDGFGPAVDGVEATIDELERFAENGFVSDPKYVERLDSVFTYRDKQNCERLYDEIINLERVDEDVR